MKIRHLMSVLALSGTMMVAVPGALAQNSEEAAARVPVENYLKGHATGDPNYFRQAFHPDAKLFFIRDGKFTQITSADYIARAGGTPPADEAQRKRRIANLDVTGNSGVAKVELDYPDAYITDYLALLKIDGEWKIINKIFYSERKQKAAAQR